MNILEDARFWGQIIEDSRRTPGRTMRTVKALYRWLDDFCRAGTEPINHAVDRMLRSLRVVDHPAPDYREAR